MDGELGGFVEIFVQAHGDEVRGRFGAGPAQVHVFAHDELERADQGSLHSGDVDFAVALAGVAVADLEERAGGVHGNVQRSAGDKVFVVEIAGVNPGRIAADAAGGFRRSDAHTAEKWGERDVDAGGGRRDLPVDGRRFRRFPPGGREGV